MAIITGSLASVNSVPTEGTVLVRALTLRPGSTFAVTGEPKVAVIKAGHFVIEDVEPGPVQLTIQGNGATHDIRVDVPDEDEVDFLDLLENVYDWEPEQISAVKLAAREARKSADEAGRIAAAFRGAEQLEGWAESASGSAASAASSAGEAAVSAGAAADSAAVATEQAEAAEVSATSAAGSADEAGAAAGRAESSAAAAAASEGAAEASAASASASATEAGAHADRAEGVVDSVRWDDDRLTVAGKTSPSLRGPKGEPGGVRGFAIEGEDKDPVASGSGSLAAGWWANAAGERSTAVGHSTNAAGNDSTAVGRGANTAGDSSTAVGRGANALANYSTAIGYNSWVSYTHGYSTAIGYGARTTAEKQVRVGNTSSGYHVSLAGDVRLTDAPSRDDNATTKAYVDGEVAEAKALAETRPAFFSGKGAPPATIPGAVVGDYYLDESTMELHKITGV